MYHRLSLIQAGLTSDSVGISTFTPVGVEVPHPEEVNPDKLSLALEPEVAALYAHHCSSVYGPPPERYMVVDIGGGTVDITVHDKSNGEINVILLPMGNTWGGTTINEALANLLEDILEDKGFGNFEKDHPVSAKAALNKLLYEEFEKRKKIFGNAKADIKEIVLRLPKKLTKFYTEKKLNEACKRLNVFYDPGDDSISLNYDIVREKIFQFTIDRIIECVRSAFDQLTSKVDTVYLVGGFGGCKFVSQKIEEAIIGQYGNIPIVCPEQPDLAVVIGAVMWRKDPNIIQSRVADATYGIRVGVKFDPAIHDEYYRFLNEDGKQRCRDVFNVFVLKGEEIRDKVYKDTIIPQYQSNTLEGIIIYSTTDDGVQYIKDKKGKLTVRKIGKLVLDIPNPDNIPRKERKIDIFMDFSGTEIQARAQYLTGGEVKTVCDFLCNQD